MRSSHRLVPPRTGPILSPRTLELEGPPADILGFGSEADLASGPADRWQRLRQDLGKEGWVIDVEGGARWIGPRRVLLLAERDLRMDATALRNTRLFQVGCIAEFLAALVAGFLWPSLGHPAWQGLALTGLAIAGAVGLVASLARVDFVSQLLVLTERAAPLTPPSGGGAVASSERTGAVYAARVITRNWEVLGDRGGRKVVRWEHSPESDAALRWASQSLADPRANESGAESPSQPRLVGEQPTVPDGFK
jgi:hypothetical protein